MAWVAIIKDFQRVNNEWVVSVDYLDDANPEGQTLPQTFRFPLLIHKQEAINAIIQKGQELRATMAMDAPRIIGYKITIP